MLLDRLVHFLAVLGLLAIFAFGYLMALLLNGGF
jgi:hypothetical protein